MEWFRWYHGTTTDAKFTVIARRSKQHRTVVIAVWSAILEYASSRKERGSVFDIDLEEVAAALDLATEQVEAVYSAMVEKEMIDGGRLKNWAKRQPKREDETGAERKERWKQRQQEERNTNGTYPERTGTQDLTSGTGGTCKNRTEQSIAEQSIDPPHIPPGGGVRQADALFELFWQAYPKKIGKDAARKAFAKRRPSRTMTEIMIAAVEQQMSSPQWARDGGQFIPHPATWLNQGRWEDDVGDVVMGGDVRAQNHQAAREFCDE